MGRAQFQVLIIPFRESAHGKPEYAVAKRSDLNMWQFLSGGGEDQETVIEAAKREAKEEGNIAGDSEFMELDSRASIPAECFAAHKEWGDDVYVVPEYCFGVSMNDKELVLSSEHTEARWLGYEEAASLLTWDSNKVALWELNRRLTKV